MDLPYPDIRTTRTIAYQRTDMGLETDPRTASLRSARQKPSVPVLATISDDRSQGSEFDSESHILFALKRPIANGASESKQQRDSPVVREPVPVVPEQLHGPVPMRRSPRRGEYEEFDVRTRERDGDLPDFLRHRRLPEETSPIRFREERIVRRARSVSPPEPKYKHSRTRIVEKIKGSPVARRRSPSPSPSPPLSVRSTSPLNPRGVSLKQRRTGEYNEAENRGDDNDNDSSETEANVINDQNDLVDNALHLIASALNIQDGPTLTMETLKAYAMDLKSKEQAQQASYVYPRVQLVHRVLQQSRSMKKHMYLDQPMWLEGETSSREALAGNLPLSNISSYLSKHPEVCCILYRDYDTASLLETESMDEEWDAQFKPKHTAEAVELVAADLETALAKYLDYYHFNTKDDITAEFPVPYIAIYHTRGDALRHFLVTLEDEQQVQFQVLLDFITSQYKDEFNLVDYMTSKGRITQEYIKYLFKPGDIIIQGQDQNSRGYMCQSWLEEAKVNETSKKVKAKTTFSITAWSWDFDGEFSKKESDLGVEFDTNDCSEKNINDLSMRPLHYTDEATKTRLKTRGEWLWKCRVRHMVSYNYTPEGLHHSSDERYMVDMTMYRELHKSNKMITFDGFVPGHEYANLDPEAMKQEHPPDNDFIYLAPLTVKAYNLKRKKWVDLQLDGLREVSWNTRAFESLVIKEKTKRLIQALISNQIEAEKGTDLISGKGNGLILLLHGGPGTGKTLTAESVAEIAKKPLYPVTCGDIGTNPEDVEKYLESVLYLGKTWECVVLLDEADVFLEQRSLADLQRNALVSVFLRVLEYYDGILILTSNRVGTFDDAFKSRIQLAVHYSSLTTHQRTKIWGNFLQRLKELNEEGVDFLDLEDNIEQLASRAMNGREIRNAITTARQYARWERQQDDDFKLNYKVMKEVIETAGEFDEYINTLNGGLTQEQLATEEGLR